jgi:hypothetical protein
VDCAEAGGLPEAKDRHRPAACPRVRAAAEREHQDGDPVAVRAERSEAGELGAHDLRSAYLLPEGGLADHHDELRVLGAQDGPLPRGQGVRDPDLGPRRDERVMLGDGTRVALGAQERRHPVALVHEDLRSSRLQPQVLPGSARQHVGVLLLPAAGAARAGERHQAGALALAHAVLGEQVPRVIGTDPPHSRLDPADLGAVAIEHPCGIIQAEPPLQPVAAQRRPQHPQPY